MDNLRLVLLIVGVFFVFGIYLWDIFFNTESQKRKTILDAIDKLPGLLRYKNNDTDKSAITNLDEELQEAPKDDTTLPKIGHWNDIEEGEVPSLRMDDSANLIETDSNIQAGITQQIDLKPERKTPYDTYNDVLILFVTSSADTLFSGPSISQVADQVGMVYGHMNIFHYFGTDEIQSDQALFSMANMFEPGSFNLSKMAELKTKGVAIFMYSPVSIESKAVFGLFLNATQRIAAFLGGDIRTEDKELLTTSKIKLLYDKAESLSIYDG